MARPQTVFSELQVAMGITPDKEIGNVNQINQAIWQKEHEERLARNLNSPEQLYKAGRMIAAYVQGQGVTHFNVDWEGNNPQPSENRVAVDLMIHPLNLRVSVKENARIVVNAAPATIFDDVFHGKIPTTKRRDDWFMRVANTELDAYFVVLGGKELTGHETVADFYQHNDRDNRKTFSRMIPTMENTGATEYQDLVDQVSLHTTALCNKAITPELYQSYLYYFFRINAVPHVLAGLEDGEAFAILVPGATQFNKQFRLKNLTAIAHKAGQAEVKLHFKIEEIGNGKIHDLYQKIEIRWSHGKFCGSPEAKVYSYNWKWSELPWVTNLENSNE